MENFEKGKIEDKKILLLEQIFKKIDKVEEKLAKLRQESAKKGKTPKASAEWGIKIFDIEEALADSLQKNLAEIVEFGPPDETMRFVFKTALEDALSKFDFRKFKETIKKFLGTL